MEFQAPPSQYDVVWSAAQLGRDYTLIIRHDASSVKQDLYAFIRRVAGLVVIISIFVTLGAWIALKPIVVTPILKLRGDLNRCLLRICRVSRQIHHSIGKYIAGNRLTMGIYPKEKITLAFQTKNPGAKLCLRPVTVDFHCHQGYMPRVWVNSRANFIWLTLAFHPLYILSGPWALRLVPSSQKTTLFSWINQLNQ